MFHAQKRKLNLNFTTSEHSSLKIVEKKRKQYIARFLFGFIFVIVFLHLKLKTVVRFFKGSRNKITSFSSLEHLCLECGFDFPLESKESSDLQEVICPIL